MKKIMILILSLFAISLVSAQLNLCPPVQGNEPTCIDDPQGTCAFVCGNDVCEGDLFWWDPQGDYYSICAAGTLPGGCYQVVGYSYVNHDVSESTCGSLGYHWIDDPEFCPTYYGVDCEPCFEDQDCIDRGDIGPICVDNRCVECETDRDCDEGKVCGNDYFCEEPNGEPMEEIPEFGSGAIVAVLIVAIVAGVFLVKKK